MSFGIGVGGGYAYVGLEAMRRGNLSLKQVWDVGVSLSWSRLVVYTSVAGELAIVLLVASGCALYLVVVDVVVEVVF